MTTDSKSLLCGAMVNSFRLLGLIHKRFRVTVEVGSVKLKQLCIAFDLFVLSETVLCESQLKAEKIAFEKDYLLTICATDYSSAAPSRSDLCKKAVYATGSCFCRHTKMNLSKLHN